MGALWVRAVRAQPARGKVDQSLGEPLTGCRCCDLGRRRHASIILTSRQFCGTSPMTIESQTLIAPGALVPLLDPDNHPLGLATRLVSPMALAIPVHVGSEPYAYWDDIEARQEQHGDDAAPSLRNARRPPLAEPGLDWG